MNPPELKTSNLFEMASLDALGLLDAEERVAFEEAFRAAPPALQAQLRREQHRLTSVDDLLPDVEPAAGLRDRVLAAVRDAIAAVSGVAEREVIAKIVPAHWSVRSRVSPIWRAACIGFATATVVLLSVGYNVHSDYQKTLTAYLDGKMAEELQSALGPKFVNLLFDGEAVLHRFEMANTGGERAGAWVVINPDDKTGVMACKGLPEVEGEFRLAIVDENDQVQAVLAHFSSKGELMRRELTDCPLGKDVRLAILAPKPSGEPGQPVLRNHVL